jgi:hypothetical protein
MNTPFYIIYGIIIVILFILALARFVMPQYATSFGIISTIIAFGVVGFFTVGLYTHGFKH